MIASHKLSRLPVIIVLMITVKEVDLQLLVLVFNCWLADWMMTTYSMLERTFVHQ